MRAWRWRVACSCPSALGYGWVILLACFLREKNQIKRKNLPFSSRASEGKTVEVPYKGDVKNTILDILGGLRSTCTYVGAAKLKELSRRATFIRVTQQHNTVFS